MTDGMIAGRLGVLWTAAVVYLVVWTLFMPPHVTNSSSNLRFKQCSYDVMNYVSLCGEFQICGVCQSLRSPEGSGVENDVNYDV